MAVTEQYFIEAGAPVEQAAELARQHNALSGEGSTPSAEGLALPAPPVVAVPPDRVAYFRSLGVGAEQAAALAAEEASLSQGSPDFRQAAQWAEGKALAERLTLETQAQAEQQFREMHERAMEPARRALDYEIPRPVGPMGDEQIQADDAIRAALLDAQMPASMGSLIAETAGRLAESLQHASPEDIASHTAGVRSQLQGMWRDQYEANLDQVDAFVAEWAGRQPLVAAVLDRAPHLLADPYIADQLLQLAQHQRARR